MSSPVDYLRRYASIVDDVEAFLEAARSPLPRVIWANPLAADPLDVGERIKGYCPAAVPLSWHAGGWRLPTDSNPGYWVEHVVGAIHVQEEASMLAGQLVGAQPGERVLDMCAAPGGKTVQMAVAMQDQGTLVAMDRSMPRVAALRRTLERLGITCAVVHQVNAVRQTVPTDDKLFDRVLVDGPCTCEGTTRKNLGRRKSTDPGYRDTIVQIQKSLLRKAMRLVRPGGTVVYSTCTYAPEENEAVLDALPHGAAAIEPIELPQGLQVSPGVVEWEGRTYRPDVAHAIRLWPHQNNTGGFFVARIRRL